jgi:uncharacterized protein YcnI
MRYRHTSIYMALLLLAGIGIFDVSRGAAESAQDASSLPSPSAVVKPTAYVSLTPVPREKEFQIAVVVEIARGFHMNSHKPSDQYLIPTTLTAQLPAGFELRDTIYPDGRLEKFSFSPNKPLDVYTGTLTIRLRVAAGADAALGATKIPITLRYQACNDTTCLQPVKVPVEVKLEVAASGAKSRAVHPEVFSASNSPH